ncbi:MAG: helix-turn-helix transcriptional regulator [Oscillospiraceae bacterium]|nr:helix-turn-helix transcriptional regulator [Oscillospiraceae bacterium]
MAAILADALTVGERLKNLRGSRSQKEVAEAIGVTTMAISQYESGLRIPRDEIKVKLANYFKKSVTSIFYA